MSDSFSKDTVANIRLCPLCGRDNTAEPASQFSENSWKIKHCPTCTFTYLENTPAYEALEEDFAWEKTSQEEEIRRAHIRPVSYKLSNWIRPLRLALFQPKDYGKMVRKQCTHSTGNVLDMGCGDGHLLNSLSQDFTLYGIEISKELCKRADSFYRARGGHAVHASCLEGLKTFSDNFFSAAVLKSYLEHEAKPVEVLQELHRVLKPKGLAIIKVPNYNSLARCLIGKKWSGFRYPDHVNYFTPVTLKKMAEQCGYRVVSGLQDHFPISDNMYAYLYKQ